MAQHDMKVVNNIQHEQPPSPLAFLCTTPGCPAARDQVHLTETDNSQASPLIPHAVLTKQTVCTQSTHVEVLLKQVRSVVNGRYFGEPP